MFYDKDTIQRIKCALAHNVNTVAPLILNEKPEQSDQSLRFGKDRHLTIYASGPRQGRWYDFKDQDQVRGDMLDLIMKHKECSFKDAMEIGIELVGPSFLEGDIQTPSQEDYTKALRESQEKRLNIAKSQWKEMGTEAPDNVKDYLRNRKLFLPKTARYNKLPFPILQKIFKITEQDYHKGPIDALVLPLSDDRNQFQGFQQIWIQNGRKLNVKRPKRTRGILIGSSWKIGKPSNTEIVLCEGPETAMALHLSTQKTIYAAMGKNVLDCVKIPQGITHITLAPDNDPESIEACQKAVASYAEKGYNARMARRPEGPTPEGDYWDLYYDCGPQSVQAQLSTTYTD